VYSFRVPIHLVPHPVALDALTRLRDRTTDPGTYRRLTYLVAMILATEATRDLPTRAVPVETPLEATEGQALAADVVLVPVLRAGMGMAEAVLDLLPEARVGHVGLQRDEQTAVASQYFSRLPDRLAGAVVIIVDPMLATGGSAVAAASLVARTGATDIRLLSIVAAPEGLEFLQRMHPTVRIYVPIIDRGLNDQKYILPGLGDFGDRLYGTT
jgi:uracil phosphoribosyltransferase